MAIEFKPSSPSSQLIKRHRAISGSLVERLRIFEPDYHPLLSSSTQSELVTTQSQSSSNDLSLRPLTKPTVTLDLFTGSPSNHDTKPSNLIISDFILPPPISPKLQTCINLPSFIPPKPMSSFSSSLLTLNPNSTDSNLQMSNPNPSPSTSSFSSSTTNHPTSLTHTHQPLLQKKRSRGSRLGSVIRMAGTNHRRTSLANPHSLTPWSDLPPLPSSANLDIEHQFELRGLLSLSLWLLHLFYQ